MPTSDYTPTVAEIGARISSRTLDSNGKRIGTFNANTRPTATQVSELIEDSVSVVSAKLGMNVDNQYWKMAKTAAIFYTCAAVEQSLYPESTQNEASAYAAFMKRYEAQIEAAEIALNQRRPNERRIVSLQMGTLVGVRGGRLDPWANELWP